MSDELTQRLIDFAESGNQQKIEIGPDTYQGWVMEISEDGLLISTGYCDKAGKNTWLSFEDLSRAQLSYWDTKQNQWLEFKL
ncbi:MAG: hypothetical protein QM666_01075 [Acinetobacter sp.]